MEDLTKEEWLLLFKVITIAKKQKTASLPYNIISNAGYTTVPNELETVYNKLEMKVNETH